MAYRPFYTPSAAFDDTRMRDAGHDNMQGCLHRWVGYGADVTQCNNKANPYICDFGLGVGYKLALLTTELPLTIEDRVVGFVDVAAHWEREPLPAPVPVFNEKTRLYVIPKQPPKWIWELYEVKPVIGQAGGLLRQLIMLRRIAARALYRSNSEETTQFAITAAVSCNDPKLGVFRYMWRGGILAGDPRYFSDEGWLQSDVTDAFNLLQEPRLSYTEAQRHHWNEAW